MNNNRRQFIKKSFLAGILGIFAPGLIKIEDDNPTSIWRLKTVNEQLDSTMEYNYFGKKLQNGEILAVASTGCTPLSRIDGFWTVVECKKI